MSINQFKVCPAPTPITLEKIISQGGIEGSAEAYEDDHGFTHSGIDTAFLYYGGDGK